MSDPKQTPETADDYRLTYSTMFDPPASLHQRFEAALGEARALMGAARTA
jgi:hypothetical protein